MYTLTQDERINLQRYLLDKSRLCFLHNIHHSDNKLLRLLECYSRLSSTCKKQFDNYFINISMNVKQNVYLVNNAS